MDRLTEKNDELYFYPHCFEEECIGVSEPCSECEFEEKICIRLGEYEDTGLTPEQIMELKERDTAKVPIDADEDYGFFTCPSCGETIYASDNFESHKFCLNCGQRIKWEE